MRSASWMIMVLAFEISIDDRRGDQNIDLSVYEVEHNVLKLTLVHLAVGKCNICLRNQILNT